MPTFGGTSVGDFSFDFNNINWNKVLMCALVIFVAMLILCQMGIDQTKCSLLQKFGYPCNCLRTNVLSQINV